VEKKSLLRKQTKSPVEERSSREEINERICSNYIIKAYHHCLRSAYFYTQRETIPQTCFSVKQNKALLCIRVVTQPMRLVLAKLHFIEIDHWHFA